MHTVAAAHCPAMRLHVTLDDDLVAELRATIPWGERSRFIAQAIRRALVEVQRLDAARDERGSRVLARPDEEPASLLATGKAPTEPAGPNAAPRTGHYGPSYLPPANRIS